MQRRAALVHVLAQVQQMIDLVTPPSANTRAAAAKAKGGKQLSFE